MARSERQHGDEVARPPATPLTLRDSHATPPHGKAAHDADLEKRDVVPRDELLQRAALVKPAAINRNLVLKHLRQCLPRPPRERQRVRQSAAATPVRPRETGRERHDLNPRNQTLHRSNRASPGIKVVFQDGPIQLVQKGQVNGGLFLLGNFCGAQRHVATGLHANAIARQETLASQTVKHGVPIRHSQRRAFAQACQCGILAQTRKRGPLDHRRGKRDVGEATLPRTGKGGAGAHIGIPVRAAAQVRNARHKVNPSHQRHLVSLLLRRCEALHAMQRAACSRNSRRKRKQRLGLASHGNWCAPLENLSRLRQPHLVARCLGITHEYAQRLKVRGQHGREDGGFPMLLPQLPCHQKLPERLYGPALKPEFHLASPSKQLCRRDATDCGNARLFLPPYGIGARSLHLTHGISETNMH